LKNPSANPQRVAQPIPLKIVVFHRQLRKSGQGWLDAQVYAPAARNAWLGLVKFLDSDANVREVCVGTNKSFQQVGPDLPTQLKYYRDRQRRTGDLHGQAPILWTAAALLRD